jgi:hypothetical protein
MVEAGGGVDRLSLRPSGCFYGIPLGAPFVREWGGPSKPLVLIGHIREIGHRIRNRYYPLTIPAGFSGRSHIIVKNASAS